MKVHKENGKSDTAMGKDAKRERKEKHGLKKRGVVSYMLHEPNMVRLCMEGYLCVGGPASSDERHLEVV